MPIEKTQGTLVACRYRVGRIREPTDSVTASRVTASWTPCIFSSVVALRCGAVTVQGFSVRTRARSRGGLIVRFVQYTHAFKVAEAMELVRKA